MSHEKPVDTIRAAQSPEPELVGTVPQLPADAAHAAPAPAGQPAIDQLLQDGSEPTIEDALYHLLSVC